MIRHIRERAICEITPLFMCYLPVHYEFKNSKFTNNKLEALDEVFNTIIANPNDSEV
jgi:cell division GTPase FtsZ